MVHMFSYSVDIREYADQIICLMPAQFTQRKFFISYCSNLSYLPDTDTFMKAAATTKNITIIFLIKRQASL